MGHERLGNYFNINFALMQHHHWSLSDLESMVPWERYVYIDLLQEFIKIEDQKRRDADVAARTAAKPVKRM